MQPSVTARPNPPTRRPPSPHPERPHDPPEEPQTAPAKEAPTEGLGTKVPTTAVR
jgi:hypothetical protein